MPKVNLPSGVDLYYESHGEGEPLVLVPSTAYSGEVWKPSQMPLAHSLNLILFDPRGCGRSIAMQEVFTIEQMAVDIVALMDHLKIPTAHLLGHSMGGKTAMTLALAHPELVDRLVVEDVGPTGTGETSEFEHLLGALADGIRARKHPGRIENMFNALQNVVPSHLADGTLHDFKGLTAHGVASEDGDKAFDHEEFPVPGPLPALQVIQL